MAIVRKFYVYTIRVDDVVRYISGRGKARNCGRMSSLASATSFGM